MAEISITPSIQVLTTLSKLVEPESVFEIRIPKTHSHGTVAGYFNDPALAVKHVVNVDGKVPSIYFTLNPVNPMLLARSANRFEQRATTTTTDRDILKRVWLPLDFDPVRPAGISSTDEEHEAALNKAYEVKEYLTSIGWPVPLVGDSANGAHLLYRIDIPNDEKSEATVRNILYYLSATFSSDAVQVDTTVFNASRIWKLYGTISRKGDNTPDRPHRRAIVLQLPGDEKVTAAQLEDLAGKWGADATSTLKSVTGSATMDMELWLNNNNIKVSSGPHDLFGGKGKKWVLAKCPFNESHNKPIVGVVEGRPVFKCLHQSCQSNNWSDFRAKVDPSFVTYDAVAADVARAFEVDPDTALDQRYVMALSKFNLAKFDAVAKKLKAAGVSHEVVSELIQRARAARQAQMAKDSGTKWVPHNLHGLVQVIEEMQEAGVIRNLWLNELTDQIHTGAETSEERVNVEHMATDLMIQFHGEGHKWVKKTHTMDAITYIAKKNAINPIKTWLDSITWDGVPRIDTWLNYYMGVEDNEYTRAAGRKWLISACARAMTPGCQADHMLIFEGKQGIGKSQALRILGGNYHVEYAGSLVATDNDYKNTVHTMIGKMIIEISELHAFKKSSIEGLRNFLTATVDDVRLAYRRDSARFPRSVVFAGTTNEIRTAYIEDPTGARRFWPVICGTINIPDLARDRDQLWAEAVAAFKSGEDWFRMPEGTYTEQQLRTPQDDEDIMLVKVLDHLMSPENLQQGFTALHQLFENGRKLRGVKGFTIGVPNIAVALEVWLNLSPSAPARSHQRALTVFKRLGFVRKQTAQHCATRIWIWDPAQCSVRFALPQLRECIRTFVHRTGNWDLAIDGEFVPMMEHIDEGYENEQ